MKPGASRAPLALAVFALAVAGGTWLHALWFDARTTPLVYANPRGEISPAASGTTVNVVAFGDSKGRTAVYGRALADARASRADALLVLGDMVEQNSDFEFRWAVEHAWSGRSAPFELPIFVTIGNHEGFDRHDHLSRDSYKLRFGPPVSWFRTKGVLFVSIDTADEKSFPEEQAREVESILAAERPRSEHAVFLTHVPPLVGEPVKDKRGYTKMLEPADSARLLSLVDKYGIELILAGHYHGFAERKHRGARVVISGGGGGTLDDPNGFFHYLRVSIAPLGVNVEVARVDDAPGPDHARYLLLKHANAVGTVATVVALACLALAFLRRRKNST